MNIQEKSSNNGKVGRLEDRYRVAARITIQRVAADDNDMFDAELVDLSTGGAKFVVPNCLHFCEAVELRIHVSEIGLDISVNAQVCWMRTNEDGTWIVGCSFTPGISEEILLELGVGGYIDRRREQRHHANISATASWQLDKEQTPVVVSDYSTAGFCLSTPKVGTVGQRIILRLESAEESHTIAGMVQWQVKAHDTRLMGCTFTNGDGFRHLRAVVQSYGETQTGT